MLAISFCAMALPATAQPFTCGGYFIGNDTQAKLAHTILEDGGRAIGITQVFTICQKGIIQVVLDGNNETSTPSYKTRWQQRAATLLQIPQDKVIVR